MSKREPALSAALVLAGIACLMLFPLSLVWPSGWAWHDGPPAANNYFMMIVALYVTLGIFLIRAAKDPLANLSLIWFAIWSSIAHALVMTWQSFSQPGHKGHLAGDVPALLILAVALALLTSRAQMARAAAA